MDVYAPMVHLTNCSGTGKTRIALELGNATNVLFLKFGSNYSLPASRVGKRIIQFFHSSFPTKHRLVTSAAMHLILQRILDVCGKVFACQEDLEGALIVDDVFDLYFAKHPDTQSPEFEGLDFDQKVEKTLFKEIADVDVSKSDCDDFDNGKPTNFANDLKSEASNLMTTNEVWLAKRFAKLQGSLDDGLKESASSLPKLLIVCDEAHKLMKEYSSPANPNMLTVITNDKNLEIDMHRLLRGTLRFFRFYWAHSLCITISTVAKVSEFDPRPVDDPTYCDNLMHIPILLLHTFDVFRGSPFVESTVPNWMDYLFDYKRVVYIATCGRPLWALRFAKVLWMNFSHVKEPVKSFYLLNESNLSVAFNKLGRNVVGLEKFSFAVDVSGGLEVIDNSRNPSVDEPENEVESTIQFKRLEESKNKIVDEKAVALLALSVALQKFPKNTDIAELVRVGPMALLDVNVETQKVEAMPCSEGIFNGIATLMLIKYLDKVGDWLLDWTKAQDSCMLSIGEIGEIINRISILKALHDAGRTKTLERLKGKPLYKARTYSEFLFEPVSLEEFLESYAGPEAATAYLRKHAGLKGSFVAFSHFIYMGKDSFTTNPYDVAANALSRGAAVVPCQDPPDVGTMIPLVLEDGRLSYVYIQTKTGPYCDDFPSNSEVASSSPSNCFERKVEKKGCKQMIHETTVIEDRPYCHIYRQYNGQKGYAYKVFAQGTGSIRHQPCLALSGEVHCLGYRYDGIVERLCPKEDFEFLNVNKSLENTWVNPALGTDIRTELIPMEERLKKISRNTRTTLMPATSTGSSSTPSQRAKRQRSSSRRPPI